VSQRQVTSWNKDRNMIIECSCIFNWMGHGHQL